jgi:hypothetical protein
LVFRQIVLKNFREIIHKAFRVQIILELFAQELFKGVLHALLDQARFQAVPPQDVPLRRHHVRNVHLIDNIDRLHSGRNAGEEFVVGGRILTLNQRRRTKYL